MSSRSWVLGAPSMGSHFEARGMGRSMSPQCCLWDPCSLNCRDRDGQRIARLCTVTLWRDGHCNTSTLFLRCTCDTPSSPSHGLATGVCRFSLTPFVLMCVSAHEPPALPTHGIPVRRVVSLTLAVFAQGGGGVHVGDSGCSTYAISRAYVAWWSSPSRLMSIRTPKPR